MDQRNLEDGPNVAWEQERLFLADQRLQARQGDLAAIRDLLNQNLAKHQILVHPVPGKNALHLELGAQRWPEAGAAGGKIVRRWVAQALGEIGPLPWDEVTLVAYQLDQHQRKATEAPVWVERFNLGSRGDRPAAPQSPVVSRAKSSNSQPASSRPTKAPAPTHKALQSHSIQQEGWQALGIGLGLAGLIWKLPFLKVLLYGLVILVHELGHALTHWIFGRPAIPSVNLLFGGGITLSGHQSSILLLLIYAGLGYMVYLCRQTPRLAVLLAVAMGIHGLCVMGKLDESLPLFMGHGAEAIVITLCLYLSASGQLCRFAFDQTIYGLLGWFLLIQGVTFAWGLQTDLVARSLYEAGIGGMLDNDFVKLSNYYWGWSLESIALLFLLLCLMAPVGAFLLHRYRAWLGQAWQFLLSPEL